VQQLEIGHIRHRHPQAFEVHSTLGGNRPSTRLMDAGAAWWLHLDALRDR
jgi:hypothetical protein